MSRYPFGLVGLPSLKMTNPRSRPSVRFTAAQGAGFACCCSLSTHALTIFHNPSRSMVQARAAGGNCRMTASAIQLFNFAARFMFCVLFSILFAASSSADQRGPESALPIQRRRRRQYDDDIKDFPLRFFTSASPRPPEQAWPALARNSPDSGIISQIARSLKGSRFGHHGLRLRPVGVAREFMK